MNHLNPQNLKEIYIFAAEDIQEPMTDTIKNIIGKLADVFVFTAEDFPIPFDKQNTVTKVLNNMVAAYCNVFPVFTVLPRYRRDAARHVPTITARRAKRCLRKQNVK